MSRMPLVKATPGISGMMAPMIMLLKCEPNPIRYKLKQIMDDNNPLVTVFTIRERCLEPMKSTKTQSKRPAIKEARQSAKPPPKRMQKAALPTPEAKTCSQARLGFMARICCSRSSICSKVHCPASTSRESWLTATTLSKLAPRIGMNFERA